MLKDKHLTLAICHLDFSTNNKKKKRSVWSKQRWTSYNSRKSRQERMPGLEVEWAYFASGLAQVIKCHLRTLIISERVNQVVEMISCKHSRIQTMKSIRSLKILKMMASISMLMILGMNLKLRKCDISDIKINEQRCLEIFIYRLHTLSHWESVSLNVVRSIQK